MRETKTKDDRGSSSAGALPATLGPGKSTLTSQPGAAPSGRDGDRPASPGMPAPVNQAAPVATHAPDAPPRQLAIYPIDFNPRSVAGEQIIFGAAYDHDHPGSFQLVYTSLGGHFDSQGSGVSSKKILGLEAVNLDWYVDAQWNGTSPAVVRLEVQKVDGTVVLTQAWRFGKKSHHPMTIRQHEGEGEQGIPARYLYELGPSSSAAKNDYTGYTILEKFSPNRSNLKVADIKPAYANTHGLDSDAKVTAHFFPGPSAHGTFTVSPDNLMADVHKGIEGAAEAKAQLVAPKQIERSVDQTYESNPGTPLGQYRITRILKPDGSRKLTKKKL